MFTWLPVRSYRVLQETWADWMEVKSTAKERSHSAVVPSSVTEKATPDTDSDWDLVFACRPFEKRTGPAKLGAMRAVKR